MRTNARVRMRAPAGVLYSFFLSKGATFFLTTCIMEILSHPLSYPAFYQPNHYASAR